MTTEGRRDGAENEKSTLEFYQHQNVPFQNNISKHIHSIKYQWKEYLLKWLLKFKNLQES